MHLQINFNPQKPETLNGNGHPQHCDTKHLNEQHPHGFLFFFFALAHKTQTKLFCLSYFTSFIGFYWQRDLNFSKRHLAVAVCCPVGVSPGFGLIVSHFLWPVFRLQGHKQVALGYVDPASWT